MSGYIWIIDVVGNQNVNTADILNACEEIGIKTGVGADKITPKPDAQELLLKLDSLAWASFNIEGCRLTVNVTEVKKKSDDNTVATNLKASEDGVITHIDVTSGNCVVKVGDVVKKGDLLVSGIIETESQTRFVHSAGKIIASAEIPIVLEEKIKKQVSYPTGEVTKRSVLEFFGLKIPLYLGAVKGDYIAESNTKTARLFSQNLPIKLHTKRFRLTRSTNIKYKYEEVVANLEKRLSKEYNGKVKQKEFIKTENTVLLSAVLIEKKNIAESEALNIKTQTKT